MGTRRRAQLAAMVTAGLLLTGCGSDASSARDADPATGSSSSAASSSDPTAAGSSAAPAGTPACTKVWRAGSRLASGYVGCEAGGVLVEPDALGCSSGQAIVRYADRYWAVAGGEVARAEADLLSDQRYKKDLASCRG